MSKEEKCKAPANAAESEVKESAEQTKDTAEVKKEEKEPQKEKHGNKAEKELVAAKAENEKLQKELAAAKDAGLRLAAEYDNYRKRTSREKEAAYGDAKAATITEILPLVDNFDRALGNQTQELEAFRKGIEMTASQFCEVLKKLGVESFGEVGDSFDPALHNAVMHTENAELPEGSVSAVFSKGYKLGDRILRCAAVQVAN